ncbi:hypothetical protein AgCh_040009 [Apium graveolens]
MESPVKKKLRNFEDEDKISKLSDDVIHTILSFLDAKAAVLTSVLSKRWKLVWTTLRVLNFGVYEHSSPENTCSFIRHVLSNRNHNSNISQLRLCSTQCIPSDYLVYNFVVDDFVEYAISHNVQYINLQIFYHHPTFKLSTLSSKSLKELTLRVKLMEFAVESEYWDLPALKYLHLARPTERSRAFLSIHHKLPESCLTCLPALRTLGLENWDLSVSSFSFSLPDLTTLRVCRCTIFPGKIWNFPALSTLELDDVDFVVNMSDIFTTLDNLQNLTLSLTRSNMEQYHTISSPQLLNLNIKINSSDSLYGNIEVLAPKLCNFSCVGILSVRFEVPELETVTIKSCPWSGKLDWIYRKKLSYLLTDMLSGLGNAKNLSFDLSSIEALSATDSLASLPSPFYDLKILKLPPGYKELSMPGALRIYLLGGSPKATIVTTLSQFKVNHLAVPVSRTPQKVILDEPFAIPTNVYSVVDANRGRQIGVPVEGTTSDRASSSRGDSDSGLWHGHEVKLEFVGLLDVIMKNYPETFAHSTAKSKRDLFADLQRWGFNVIWLVSHLNYIEQLLLSQHELQGTDSCMDDTENKLQDLQSYCLEKIREIQKASG